MNKKFNIREWKATHIDEAAPPVNEKKDKYENDTRGYIEKVLAKMSRRELERTHGEYYSSTNLSSSSDRGLKIDILAGRYGREEAQYWGRGIH